MFFCLCLPDLTQIEIERGLIDYGFEMEEGPTNKTTLGTPVNHTIDTDRTVDYAVVHRISEKVTKRPSMLVCGKSKDY